MRSSASCPAYNVSRLNLFTGNDVHLQSELVQIDAGTTNAAIWSCPPTTRSSPPARWADTAPSCTEVLESHTHRTPPKPQQTRPL